MSPFLVWRSACAPRRLRLGRPRSVRRQSLLNLLIAIGLGASLAACCGTEQAQVTVTETSTEPASEPPPTTSEEGPAQTAGSFATEREKRKR